MISTKFYAGYDEEIYLSDWAHDGQMSDDAVKKLELEFLCAIEWNIYISNEEFFNKLASIEQQLAEREGLRRGWLTYTELSQLLPSIKLAHYLLRNFTVVAVGYAVSVLTIASAFFLAYHLPADMLERQTSAEVYDESVSLQAHTQHTINNGTDGERNSTIEHGVNTTVTFLAVNKNSGCVLDAEAELMTLKKQYEEEAKREQLRRRQYEIESMSRIMIRDAVQNKKNGRQQCIPNFQAINYERNWLTLKEEYSDGELLDPIFSESRQIQNQNELLLFTRQQNSSFYINLFEYFGNSTGTIFWQLMANAAHQSDVQLLTFRFI